MPWQMLETIAKLWTVITFAHQNIPDLDNFPGREMVSNLTSWSDVSIAFDPYTWRH